MTLRQPVDDLAKRCGVRVPCCKLFTLAFSKSANECASVVAAYLCPFDAVSIVQVRFHHSVSLARG
jgi:hypothetical protein